MALFIQLYLALKYNSIMFNPNAKLKALRFLIRNIKVNLKYPDHNSLKVVDIQVHAKNLTELTRILQWNLHNTIPRRLEGKSALLRNFSLQRSSLVNFIIGIEYEVGKPKLVGDPEVTIKNFLLVLEEVLTLHINNGYVYENELDPTLISILNTTRNLIHFLRVNPKRGQDYELLKNT